MELRPYQQTLRDDALNLFDGSVRRLLIQAATGSGKTVVFTSIADHYLAQGLPILVLSHRREILQQAKSKLEAVTGQKVGIIQGSVKPNYDLPIQVGSIQTIVNRLDKVGRFGLIISDECHHCSSSTYRKVLRHFDKAHPLGVSETHRRMDGQGLEVHYDHLICGPTVEKLIDDGYLSDFKLFADSQAMRTGRKIGGDYSARYVSDLNNAIELSGRLIESYQRHCPGAKMIVFGINCEHSRQIAQQYNAAGIPSAHLDAKSSDSERCRTLEDFAAGKSLVRSIVYLFLVGCVSPYIEAVLISRPSASLTKHLQMMGRALRPAKGKEYATLLDHTNNWKRLGTPKRKHFWILEGNPKGKDTRITRRDRNGEVTEIERPKIIEKRVELVQVSEDATSEILDFGSYAPKPNPKIQPPANQSYESLQELWESVVEQLQPMGTKVLFRQQGRLLGFTRNGLRAIIQLKNENLLKMANDRIENLRTAFSLVLEESVDVSVVTEGQCDSLRSMIDPTFLPLPVRCPMPAA